MKTRINKKGFTIVELVIVIAVIGILTAILVPVFINLTNKANEASDNSLVKNLNTALRMEEQTAGHKKAPTLQGAIDDLENQGYLLENLQSKSGLDLLWDQEDNQFLLNKDGVAGAKYWKIVDTLPGLDQQVYSYYAGQHFSANAVANVKYGFDAGDNEGIEKVTFENKGAAREGTIAIRTNGGELTINAPQDSVNHYGYVDSLKIQAIKGSSHHEYGVVKFIEISVGRIAMENGSKVDHIHINAKETTAEKPTEFDEVIIAKDQSVDMPKLSRDDVEIDATNGTRVVALQEGTEEVTPTTELDYVWLTKQGIYEQITVSSSKTDKGSTWVDTSDKSAETKDAAKQIANNIGRNEDGKVAETTTVDEKEYNVTVDPETREIVVKDAVTGDAASAEVAEKAKEQTVEVQPDKADVETGAVLFAGGTGTQKDPFLIVDYDTFQHVTDLYDEGYYYFKVKDGVESIDCTGWTPVKLHGSFNGNNVKLNNVTACLFMNVGYQLAEEEIKLSNLEATMNVSSNGQYGAAALVKNIFNSGVTTFDNVKVHGYLEGFWNMGSFYNYGTANYDNHGSNYEVVFNNCYSDATLVCASGNTIGGLFGHAYEGAGNSFTLRVNNTEYAGQMYLTTNSGKGNKYFGMTSDYYNSLNHFFFDGVEDTFNNGSTKNSGAYTNSTKITNVVAVKGNEGYTIAKQSNVSRIVVTITAQLTAYDSQNEKIVNLSGITMTLSSTELTELDGASIKIFDLFSSINITKNASEYNAGVVNNVLNISLASSSNYKSGNIRLQVNQYDSTGNIVSAGTIDIATCANATSEWIIK